MELNQKLFWATNFKTHLCPREDMCSSASEIGGVVIILLTLSKAQQFAEPTLKCELDRRAGFLTR